MPLLSRRGSRWPSSRRPPSLARRCAAFGVKFLDYKYFCIERIDETACEVGDLFRANPNAILQDVIGDEGETLVVKSSRLTIDIPPRLVLIKHRHKPIKRTDPRAERNKIGLAASAP